MERRLDGSGAENSQGKAPATLREACMQASLFLEERGIGEPRPNAELLLMHLLGIERAALMRDWQEPFPQQRHSEWEGLVQRKAAGEPVQYIIGEQWFYGLPFTVTPAVLIPRPETELLIEAVLEAADRLWPEAAGSMAAAATPAGGHGAGAERRGSGCGPTVLDVGTGSGAIGVTLAAQRPQWRVCASDLSPDALEVARTNAARHGAAARMAFVQGDLLAPFLRRREAATGAPGGEDNAAAGMRIDVLVSNPPYIPAGDIAGLQPEVRDHEPRLALDGGADGLAPYRAIVAQLPQLAAMPQIVAFELGLGQAEAVAGLLRQCGAWREIRTIRDYAGIDRHVMAVGIAQE
ncbi:peptide chain release factor N(5)-glutamine methyltransferase [Paenibacillus spongiae]|uniref:Release factor glutamine methyltransferase n=1 Tax=Paenibacillus spongiae TaxID=2909671 RepID=A0ABY5S7T5_9BACL|nr:peptide chain release factor N(5)-glutamine methyltransferase [Paenibacillus spongiae]UVI29964.1 peptide chain release factor N(5)-glutamine methyltransferase [Paenibacillus spongiae]